MKNLCKSLNIIFAGTPLFAAQHLQCLIHSHHNIIGVFTKSDNIKSRKKNSLKNPVTLLSLKNNIPLYQVDFFSYKTKKLIKEMNADLIIVVAYGIIIPKSILKIPHLGCINVHGSLLPRWRGPSPIQYAIMYGDKVTGVSIIKMDKGIDTGNIIHQISCKINFNDTSETLYKKLSKIGQTALMISIDQIANNQVQEKIQKHNDATYSYKLTKEKGMINWLHSAKKIERRIRAFVPWPTSFFYIKNIKITVWEADIIRNVTYHNPGKIILANKKGIQISTSKNILNIQKLQLPNKKIMTVQEILNSKRSLFLENTSC